MGSSGSHTGQKDRGQHQDQGESGRPPPPPVHTKGVFSLQTQISQCPCPSQASGSTRLARQGWEAQGRAGGAGNAGPLPVLPQLGSQPCHHLSPEVQGRWSSRGRGSLGWRVQLQEGARGRGSSQTPCRYCPLNELQGTGLGSSQAQGLEGLVLSQVFTEE